MAQGKERRRKKKQNTGDRIKGDQPKADAVGWRSAALKVKGERIKDKGERLEEGSARSKERRAKSPSEIEVQWHFNGQDASLRRITRKDIVRSYGSEDNRVLVKMKGKSIFHGDGALPSILDSLDFFDSKRGMCHIIQKQLQLFLESLPDLLRQRFILLLEPIAEAVFFYLSNHSMPSSAV
jgi:hypothetical protein